MNASNKGASGPNRKVERDQAPPQADEHWEVAAREAVRDEREGWLHEVAQRLSYTVHALTHDLREPIRTVACYSELLQTHEAIQTEPNLCEFVHIINGAARRMDALVHRMLAYAQLIGEEQPVHSAVDMNSVVQAALANLQLKIEESSATVAYDTLPPTSGDFVQLVELVQNLVANAITYCGDSSPQIIIRAERAADRELFSIIDNGIGIEPQYCASIFEPFKRLHGQQISGSGLGLAICRQIVELHGGTIWVESLPQQGSSFRFTLPAVFA